STSTGGQRANAERNPMADTDCPACGERGRLATNYSLDWFRCTKCRETYHVEHTTCSVSGCGSWVDDEDSGLCHHHDGQTDNQSAGELYPATNDEQPPMCSQPACIAVADHDVRCWEHPLPHDPPDAPEERELPMCAHRGCLNEPDT